MARKAAPDSPWPKYGLEGFTDTELKYIDKFLKRKQLSFSYLRSHLFRQWIKGKDLSKIDGVNIDEI